VEARDCLMAGISGPSHGFVEFFSDRPPVGSNPDSSPEKRSAPKSVHMRFVGSLEKGHFYISSFLWLMCRNAA
jgi:hypothetical protein